MLRAIVFTLIYLCLLGAVSIDVTFKDGLHLKFTGWAEQIGKKKRRRKKRG